MSTELIKAIAQVAGRASHAAAGPVSLAVVRDPRPERLSATVQGFDEPVRMISADWFDLTPLQAGDVVGCLRVTGGVWLAFCRVSGAEPELEIGLWQIDGNVPVVGEQVSEEGNDGALFQSFRSDAISAPIGDSTRTWVYPRPYHASPVVVAVMEAPLNGHRLNVSLGVVGEDSVTFLVRNDHDSPVSSRVVALALGGS